MVHATGAQWGSPAVGADGTIYVVHNAVPEPGAELVAIAATGATTWTVPLGAVPDAAPSIGADGTIYVAWQSPVYAIGPDGSMEWSTDDGIDHFGATIGPDGTVYTGGGGDDLGTGAVYALSPADGSTLWSMPTGDDIAWPPAVGPDGTVYVSSVLDEVPFASQINALAPDGSVTWQLTTAQRFFTSPLVDANGRVYVGTNPYVQPPVLVGSVVAIDPPGTIAWTLQTGEVDVTPSLGADGTVYVASENGLWAVRPDGTPRWHASPGVQMRSSAAIDADGTAYVGSEDGSVLAVTASGASLWTFAGAMGFVLSPAIGADGTVYAGGAELFFDFAP
jgi:outer membrane protein assembly factor BamB